MANDVVPAIFEAALEHGGARVRVDVLERHVGGAWIINEVKASTKVKDWHIPDVAVQVWVARDMGLNVSAAKVIRIDPSYVRGESIDWTRLFSRDDVTEQMTFYLEGLPATIAEQLAAVASEVRPQIEPSSHCDKPHPCEFWERCTSRKPKDWIFHLPRIKADLFEELSAVGVQRIGDIPNDATLNGLQARVRDCHRTGRPYVSRGLKKALKPIRDEAWYFDLEAVAPAIPLWPGIHPYERMPFQWSLHHRRAPGSLHHEEFLAEGRDDPRRAFAERLLKTIDPGDVPIVVYSSYEKQVIDELACNFPDLSAQLLSLRERLFDLLPVIREHYYHVGFGGSFSIKAVGPTLAPDVDYARLEGIAKGDQASEAFERLVTDALKQGETPQQIRKGLLSYCKLDTLALVRVHEALTEAGNAS
jgi:predicted RecB family nuclease